MSVPTPTPATTPTTPPPAVPVGLPRFLARLAGDDPVAQGVLKGRLLRALIVLNLGFGTWYIVWRALYSVNWALWPLGVALLLAELYSYVDCWLFGLTMWRFRVRGAPPPPPDDATVDVFITCYNEPVELVRETARAARAIRYPHHTWILDDGASPAMAAMAREEGVGYLTRSDAWTGKSRHAKAGNLINALGQTDGDFFLVLDADQVPRPEILDRTLGYFRDAKVAFVQTPQWFWNIPAGDPFGNDAPLFYGPIQQGKDGWNAAFFCGSNAVLRRDALMTIGLANYARELEARARVALAAADGALRKAEAGVAGPDAERTRAGLRAVREAAADARAALSRNEPLQDVTWRFQRRVEAVAGESVAGDVAAIDALLADLPGDDAAAAREGLRGARDGLALRDRSPLTAFPAVTALLHALDLDRPDEAEPVRPLATISVTEDMATAMRLHGAGYTSVYHHEILAVGLAPDDLRSALQQRLRWAQGTLQVMFRENPLTQRGLSWPQRLMYFATMWSYLSGFAAIAYLAAPVLYLLFGWVPVEAYSTAFFWHLVPWLVVNQLLFVIVGWGLQTFRGQQYSLALFPLWIRAVVTTVQNVYFGRGLGFVVTPKVRQGGIFLELVRPQLVAMGLLVVGIGVGLARIALGSTETLPILVNVFWAAYDLVMLSAVVRAATWRPPEEGTGDDAARGTAA